MRACSLLSLALLGCGASLGSGSTARPEPGITLDGGDPAGFAAASNALGLDVWRALRGEEAPNLAISPASIATALAMTYGGARGETAEAMAGAMHLSSGPESTMASAGGLVRAWNDPSRTTYELAVANRLFGASRYRFAEPFVAVTRDAFGAELQRLDYAADPSAARGTINGWVSDRTHARIPELLPDGSITGDTRLVLVNAVYFHGRWEIPFDPDATFDAPFHAEAGDVSVPTMHAVGGRYGEDEGVQLLERPYAGGDVAMLFVLPRDRNGLSSVEDRLSAGTVAHWAESLGERDDLEISLPRFRIETDSMSLREPLVGLGMGVAFSDAADFTAMSDPSETPLKIDDVIHRVFVELNEEGTEAAAATGVVMVEITSAGPYREPPRFVADHPFLFFLRDLRTGAILFAGRVADPS